MKRVFAQAYGQVQGVGFRYFVQTQGKIYGLTGWVKNMADGSVTLEAQGEQETLDKFFAAIRKGEGFIKVENLEIKAIDLVDGDSQFDIKY